MWNLPQFFGSVTHRKYIQNIPRIQQKTFPIFIIVCGDRDVYYGST